MSTVIYGASDDLIEVAGDVTEEFNVYDVYDADDSPVYVGLSNGVLLKVAYDKEGFWRIRTAHKPEGASVTLIEARGDDRGRDEDGCPGYSDKVVIDGPSIKWVTCGKQMAR